MQQCRICFSHEPSVHGRNHDLECCAQCAPWVAKQPVYFPAGTARNLCGEETVQWWDLSDLYALAKGARDVAGHPLSLEQVQVSVRRLLAATLLPEAPGPIDWGLALAVRVTVRGSCVEFAVPYRGYVENEVEQVLADYDISGRRQPV